MRLTAILAAGVFATTAVAESPSPVPDPANWDAVLQDAKGETVSFAWIAQRVQEEHDVTLKHVKLSGTADAVSRVIAENPPVRPAVARST